MVNITVLIANQEGTAAIRGMQGMDHKGLTLLIHQCGVRICGKKGNFRKGKFTMSFCSPEGSFDFIGKEPVNLGMLHKQAKHIRIIMIRMAMAAEDKKLLGRIQAWDIALVIIKQPIAGLPF